MTHDGLHLVGDEINYDYLVIYNLISKKLSETPWPFWWWRDG